MATYRLTRRGERVRDLLVILSILLVVCAPALLVGIGMVRGRG